MVGRPGFLACTHSIYSEVLIYFYSRNILADIYIIKIEKNSFMGGRTEFLFGPYLFL